MILSSTSWLVKYTYVAKNTKVTAKPQNYFCALLFEIIISVAVFSSSSISPLKIVFDPCVWKVLLWGWFNLVDVWMASNFKDTMTKSLYMSPHMSGLEE